MSIRFSGVVRVLSGATPASRLAIIAAGCGALALVPVRTLDSLPDVCLWERIFGWCPAHGTLHALAALLHGHPATAVAFNPNVALVVPVLAAIVAMDVVRLLRGRRTGPQRWSTARLEGNGT